MGSENSNQRNREKNASRIGSAYHVAGKKSRGRRKDKKYQRDKGRSFDHGYSTSSNFGFMELRISFKYLSMSDSFESSNTSDLISSSIRSESLSERNFT